MPDIHHVRRMRLEAHLVERGVCAALITNLVNVRYLTGLVSSNAALMVIGGGAAVLATDARYAATAERVCPDVELLKERQVAKALVQLEGKLGLHRLAYEDHHVTVELHRELAAAAGSVELVSLGRAVESLRRVKDEQEIVLLREACAITDRAFDATIPVIRPGVTEHDVAIALERHMVDLGADKPAFDTIVASGPNGAIPHHSPGDRQIEVGDLVTMDFGALYQGYHADMTRTVAVGRIADWQRELYTLVADAQRTGSAAARPGTEVRQVDGAARDVIKDAGYGDQFPHGLGHGVGLEIHEAPLLGHDKTGKLEGRVPLTVEPGVYLTGRGGVRIEDTLVVRAEGPELLTKTTKELLVL